LVNLTDFKLRKNCFNYYFAEQMKLNQKILISRDRAARCFEDTCWNVLGLAPLNVFAQMSVEHTFSLSLRRLRLSECVSVLCVLFKRLNCTACFITVAASKQVIRGAKLKSFTAPDC